MPHSGVQIKLDRSGGVAVFCGSIDIGQGSDSILAYAVAEEFGLDPADISEAVLYLASDASRYVTGQQLKVDAGALLAVTSAGAPS